MSLLQKATLAGGCFWCIESAFIDLVGVESTRCGYTGGDLPHPSYEQVIEGNTGHVEAVEITFDPEKITFLQILEIFWHHIDPLDSGGQFADRGEQYQTAIFYQDENQRKLAFLSREAVQTLFDRPIATQILPLKTFYPAEDYHQAYCVKQPARYNAYAGSHTPFLKRLWETRHIPMTKEYLEHYLTPLQYHVTQEEGTEPPFNNSFWDDKREGIYVDIVSGEPLFVSSDKFDAHCGWPSFSRPIDEDTLQELDDYKLGVRRTEVRSKKSNAHLGHVFPDGPGPEGLRYCINSAALRFIPKNRMEQEGYGDYLHLL